MRIACSIFLVVYALIAVARAGQSPEFSWLRALLCLYAGFGIWLAGRVTWTSARAYTVGLGLLLPLHSAYINAMLGNHTAEIAVSALATFIPLVFMQAGVDLVFVVVALIGGHAAVLALAPSPAVPLLTVWVMLGGGIATGAAAGLQTLMYRGRWTESLTRLEDALTASAEWQTRYEAAILASGQLLYDWTLDPDEMRYGGGYERMLGYSEDELSGNLAGWLALVHPDDLEAFERQIRRVLAEKIPFHTRYRVRRKDGVYILVESRGRFIVDDVGDPVRMIAFVSDITERTRADAQRAEEAAISAALAHVGQELISSLETPVLLERLCRTTTEVLHCDFSTTWLWKADEGVYAALARYGITPEEWEGMRLLRLPSDASTFTQLLTDDLAQVHHDSASFPMLASALTHYGISAVLCVVLRRGGDIIGLHVAGYRKPAEGFTPAQERVARGTAQLASMALTNARLVEELERADRLKSEFVSTMSHELRTPLNVILGYVDMLGDGLWDDEQRMLLARVRQSSLELLEMIEATLNLSRLVAGKDPPQIEALPLAALWDDLRTEFDALPHATDTALRWEAVGDTILHTDRRKLKMILKNLVGNALKFTAAGEIAVRCDRYDRGAVISVRDTGVGIPAEHLPHVFDMFRQVDSSDARSYGGAGLGLYIVSQLATQLGATIEVESEPGHGSTFRVRLPDAPVPTADIAA